MVITYIYTLTLSILNKNKSKIEAYAKVTLEKQKIKLLCYINKVIRSRVKLNTIPNYLLTIHFY